MQNGWSIQTPCVYVVLHGTTQKCANYTEVVVLQSTTQSRGYYMVLQVLHRFTMTIWRYINIQVLCRIWGFADDAQIILSGIIRTPSDNTSSLSTRTIIRVHTGDHHPAAYLIDWPFPTCRELLASVDPVEWSNSEVPFSKVVKSCTVIGTGFTRKLDSPEILLSRCRDHYQLLGLLVIQQHSPIGRERNCMAYSMWKPHVGKETPRNPGVFAYVIRNPTKMTKLKLSSLPRQNHIIMRTSLKSVLHPTKLG
jgi:hypothetical protein